jgi:hypothetical protein
VGPPLYADMAARQDLLKGQIHTNSILRTTYNTIHGQLVDAANKGAAALRSGGYTVPNLSGLGFVVALAPLTAVAILVAVAGAVVIAWRLTEGQVQRTDAIAKLWGNDTIPVDQKLELMAAQRETEKAAAQANPLSLDGLIVPLALVLAILVAPTVLKAMPRRVAG